MDEYKDLIKKGMKYLDLNNLSTVGERDYKLDDLPDLSKILNEFLNQTSNRKKFHDQNEIQKLLNKTFTLNEYKSSSNLWLDIFPVEDIVFGFGGHDQISIIFSNKEICVASGLMSKDVCLIPLDYMRYLKFKERDGTGITFTGGDSLLLKEKVIGRSIVNSSEKLNLILDEIKSYFQEKRWDELGLYSLEKEKEIEEEKMRVEREKRREVELIEHEKGQKDILSKVKKIRKEILDEYDKDGNGEIDITECNDLSKILKKNQTKIIEIDRNHIQSFVKISNYLKLQRDNLKMFLKRIMSQKQEDVKDWDWYSRDFEVRSEFDFEEFSSNVEVFKDYVHSYNLLLSSSLSLIVSLTNDDMITFFEIYETLDKLNIFDSNHEKELKEKLSNIEYGLLKMRDEINVMNNQICNSLEQLSEITLESSNMITNELKSVDSSLKMNNLLQGIQVYQNYKTNRRLK
tara:strand:+ start:316 stop:1692 length:1377 start_codon:yes stop_codon:yes gene_type:complete